MWFSIFLERREIICLKEMLQNKNKQSKQDVFTFAKNSKKNLLTILSFTLSSTIFLLAYTYVCMRVYVYLSIYNGLIVMRLSAYNDTMYMHIVTFLTFLRHTRKNPFCFAAITDSVLKTLSTPMKHFDA